MTDLFYPILTVFPALFLSGYYVPADSDDFFEVIGKSPTSCSLAQKWRSIERLDAPAICKCNLNVNINVNVNVEETISNYISIGDSSSLYTYKYRRN